MSDGDPLSPAGLLRAMAARIERNDPEDFAGCFVCIPPPPPEDSVIAIDPIEILVIDPQRDEANFWALVKTKVDSESGRWAAAQQSRVPAPGSYR